MKSITNLFLKKNIQTEKYIFLVMEHASKGELFDYIVSNDKLPESEACKCFHQLISAIEYLHENGIAHRFNNLFFLNLVFSKKN